MNTQRFVLLTLLVSLLAVTASCSTPKKPTVTLTPQRILHSGTVQMHGTGFTPSANVFSHLRRPDGTEFPVLPMRTSDRGEFQHEIETLLLSPGTHEVWVEDERSKTKSEIVRFEVILEQQK